MLELKEAFLENKSDLKYTDNNESKVIEKNIGMGSKNAEQE